MSGRYLNSILLAFLNCLSQSTFKQKKECGLDLPSVQSNDYFFAAFILLKRKQSKTEWVTKPDKSKQIEVEREKNIGNNSLITVTPESYTLWMDQYFNWGMCRYYYNDDLHLRQFLLLFFFSRKQTLS